MDALEFRKENGMSQSECVRVLKEDFPGMRRGLWSHVENPAYYGIRLTASAERVLRGHVRERVRAGKKVDNRKLSNRLYFRLDDAEFEALEAVIAESPFDTRQDWLRHMVLSLIGYGKEEADAHKTTATVRFALRKEKHADIAKAGC